MHVPKLPVCNRERELKKALSRGAAVLAAPPGSGKTTVVPLLLLGEKWLAGKKILLLEPRRLAARHAAARMASLLGEEVGQTVGYRIRFEQKVSRRTRIEVVTEGILTRRLQSDPALGDVGLVIFDEFHERSLHADLALALCLDICQLKDDLRLLVMSATLDTVSVAGLLGDAPVITAEGRSYDVEIDYQGTVSGNISQTMTAALDRVLTRRCGDILAFLPGKAEILQVQRRMAALNQQENNLVLPLYGELRQQEQDRALQPDPSGRRRILLATSIAETSLTIEGIGCVVDSGWSRKPMFHPGSGLTRLRTVRVSKSSAEQRAGRAGRLGPGYCLRLWRQEEHHSLLDHHPPEIVSADLAPLVLELAHWGVRDTSEMQWLDPPPEGSCRQAVELLQYLGALNEEGVITSRGKEIAALPAHPRLALMLVKARSRGYAGLAADLAAVVEERDILRRGDDLSAEVRLRLEVLEKWRRQGGDAIRAMADAGGCRRVDRASKRWLQLLGVKKEATDLTDFERAGDLLAYAYPDRIGRRRTTQPYRYQLAMGREARLAAADPLAASEFLVAAEVGGGGTEPRIFLADIVSLEELKTHHSHLFAQTKEIFWQENECRVKAVARTLIGEIVVEEKNLANPSSEKILQAMLDGIRRMGLEALPWCRRSQQLRARVALLRRERPQEGWPRLDDTYLMDDLGWLSPYINGIRSAGDLQQLNMFTVLEGLLGFQKLQRLEHLAPAVLPVASGSKVRLEYQNQGVPVLAVRLQEMFGTVETPRICGGRVKVLLHLLSPAMRPVQVTDDLEGFWRRSYKEVKKELQGRYPKHSWPEDPLRAEALRGVKKKRRR